MTKTAARFSNEIKYIRTSLSHLAVRPQSFAECDEHNHPHYGQVKRNLKLNCSKVRIAGPQIPL